MYVCMYYVCMYVCMYVHVLYTHTHTHTPPCVWASYQKYSKSVVCSVYFQLQNTSAVQNEIVLAALYERLVTTETVISSLTPGRSPAFPAGKYRYL